MEPTTKKNKIKQPTMIKTSDLINMKLPKIESDLYLFGNLIEEFRFNYYEMDSEKFDKSKFSVFQIYDNPHDSDESSYRYLVHFNGKPSCIMGYTGDRGEFHCSFFNAETASELFNYFSSLQSSKANFDILDEEVCLDDQYTNLVQIKGELYYNLDSPKWGSIDVKKPLFKLEDDDSITPITFVRFKNKNKESWNEGEADKFIIALINEKECEVPYSKLLTKQSL